MVPQRGTAPWLRSLGNTGIGCKPARCSFLFCSLLKCLNHFLFGIKQSVGLLHLPIPHGFFFPEMEALVRSNIANISGRIIKPFLDPKCIFSLDTAFTETGHPADFAQAAHVWVVKKTQGLISCYCCVRSRSAVSMVIQKRYDLITRIVFLYS